MYHTEISSLLDMVDRGCRRLMKHGGGAVPGNAPSPNCPKRAAALSRAREMSESRLYNVRQIASECGVGITTVRNIQARLRGKTRNGKGEWSTAEEFCG
jgi:hypothetical protein